MSSSARILIVDGEPQWRAATLCLLREAGHVVAEASTGQACLRLARKNRPDLVLLGAALPDTDGIEVSSRIQSDPLLAGSYVILVSGPNTVAGQAGDLEGKADGYIVRPISNHELLARVQLTLRLKRSEEALREQTHDLGERLKELNCLYSLSRLIDKPGVALEDVLQGAVDLIPPAWQYPEVTCAQVRFEGRLFRTERFQETAWRQASDIVVNGEQAGVIEVYYLEERPEHDEGPFLKEERYLIDVVAERLGGIAERMQADEGLRRERDLARQYLDVAGAITVALNAKGEVSLINRAGCHALEGEERDILGLNWFDHFVPRHAREQVRTTFEKLMAGTIESVEYYENPVLTARGNERTIAWHNTLLTDRAGHIAGTLSSGEDITARKQAEGALHDALRTAQQRQKEVSALLAASEAILRQRHFADTARSIFDSCKDLLGATAGYVALLTEDGARNEVLFLDSGGLPCTVDPSLPMPIRGLRAETYRTGKTVYHNNFSQSEWPQYLPAGHVAMDSVLFAPLTIDGETLGLLGLANKPGGFCEDDARMALAFGELAAIALRNSRALASLANSEERFRAVVETAQDAIVSADASGNIVFWNRAAHALFGYSADEAIGEPVAMLMPERFSARHQQAMQRLVSTWEPTIVGRTLEMVGLTKEGREFPLELSLAMWKAGEKAFFTAVLRDITERKQVQEALRCYADELEVQVAERTAELRASEAQFRALFEQAVVGIAIGDTKGHVLESNRALQQALGYSAEEIHGRTFAEFSHPEDARAIVDLYRGIHERSTHDFSTELRYFRSDGHVRWANVTASLVRPAHKPPFTIGILEDMTERKQAQAALIQSEKLAAIGQLAASVAHEVNNPLQSVLGCLSLAQEVLEEGGDVSQYVGIANDELERAVRVMAQMRDLGRPSRPGERRPTDISVLVDNVLLLSRKRCRDAGVEIEWEARSDLPTAFVQPDHIRQVFLNLVLNALDAMPDGGQLRVSIECTDEPEGIRVSFTDTGIGISPSMIERMFEPFETTKESGMGLGLYVSRNVVEEHGGWIKAKSCPGEETTFTVWLPAQG